MNIPDRVSDARPRKVLLRGDVPLAQSSSNETCCCKIRRPRCLPFRAAQTARTLP